VGSEWHWLFPRSRHATDGNLVTWLDRSCCCSRSRRRFIFKGRNRRRSRRWSAPDDLLIVRRVPSPEAMLVSIGLNLSDLVELSLHLFQIRLQLLDCLAGIQIA